MPVQNSGGEIQVQDIQNLPTLVLAFVQLDEIFNIVEVKENFSIPFGVSNLFPGYTRHIIAADAAYY